MFGYVRFQRAIGYQDNIQNNLQEEDIVSLVEQLSEEQLANISIVLRYKDCYKDKLYYYENSLLMHFNPFHIQQVDMTFMVRTEDDCAIMVKDVYQDLLKNASFYKSLHRPNKVKNYSVIFPNSPFNSAKPKHLS